MSELRRDPIGGRWVIVDTDHPNIPQDYEYQHHTLHGRENCPFCYGNESMTPLEIDSIRESGGSTNTPGWQVRVVPNKFPALQIEGELARRGRGIYDMQNGIGAHEVLLETPYHEKDIPDLTNQEVESFLSMYARRTRELEKDKRFKYIMVFKNYGFAAGASIGHPHSQIIALPMVPKNVKEEIRGAHSYFEYRERCLFCDIIRQELQDKQRIITENEYFISFCPYVSRFAFELWIMPKNHSACFCRIAAAELPALAAILKETVSRMKKLFVNVSYNFIIHTSPINGDMDLEDYHWHIEFMPKLTRIAGFEWGSGFYIVSTPPEDAAKFLREQ